MCAKGRLPLQTRWPTPVEILAVTGHGRSSDEAKEKYTDQDGCGESKNADGIHWAKFLE
jgi:hypothetical protein